VAPDGFDKKKGDTPAESRFDHSSRNEKRSQNQPHDGIAEAGERFTDWQHSKERQSGNA
jgi:hypothetical protein